MQHSHPIQDLAPALPVTVNSEAAPLESDENALGTLLVDLSPQLNFAAGRLVLTDRRLLAYQAGNAASGAAWDGWRLDDPAAQRLRLRHSDHGGVGMLSLHDEHGRLAVWRFTLAQNVYALRLVTQFELQQARRSAPGAPPESDASADELALCPSCKAPLLPGSEDCPVCSREVQAVPSTWVLLRLWRFAHPYRKQDRKSVV